MLHKGQCIIRVNSIEKPFVLRVPYITREWLTDEEIIKNNRKILESKEAKSGKNRKIKSKIYCKFCRKEVVNNSEYCMNCSTKLKDEDKAFENLEKYVKQLFKEKIVIICSMNFSINN